MYNTSVSTVKFCEQCHIQYTKQSVCSNCQSTNQRHSRLDIIARQIDDTKRTLQFLNTDSSEQFDETMEELEQRLRNLRIDVLRLKEF